MEKLTKKKGFLARRDQREIRNDYMQLATVANKQHQDDTTLDLLTTCYTQVTN